jgi:nitrite reductase (NADH) large subunit
MWGGETTADELRRIADVVDKYKIPTVKVTGGQRIDLLGVKKEDLRQRVERHRHAQRPCLCQGLAHGQDLCGQRVVPHGHPRQHPNGQGPGTSHVAHVCTAQGQVRCVSGCPRNCAEAGIKDVGIIGVDSGWEMYIAGNGGIKTEVAAVLCQGQNLRRSAGVHAAPSCSCTAKKAGTWSAPFTTSTAWAWTM